MKRLVLLLCVILAGCKTLPVASTETYALYNVKKTCYSDGKCRYSEMTPEERFIELRHRQGANRDKKQEDALKKLEKK